MFDKLKGIYEKKTHWEPFVILTMACKYIAQLRVNSRWSRL